MKNINMLIKPSSSLCNIRCEYCFYNDIAAAREIPSYGFMSSDTIEEIVKKAFVYADGGMCTFAFQGGEPMLVGLDFYKGFIEAINKYGSLSRSNNVLQTNGILLDEEWARFLKENNFLVGLSLDGPKEIHDARRKNKEGHGTFYKVMKAKKIMDKVGLDYNTLIVVDNLVAKNPKSIYEFFKKEKIKYTQYIPCLAPIEDMVSKQDDVLSAKNYASFLKKLFDMWYKDLLKGHYVSIRYFDNIINSILGMGVEACDMRGVCAIQNVIEADGSVYPCDFYVYDQWKLGSIMDNNFEGLMSSKRGADFIEGSYKLATKCDKCKWLNICRGECRRRRDPKDGLNILCEAYQEFFDYAAPRLNEVARKIRLGIIHF